MLRVDFLYYDKSTCKRCISTNESLELTLKELKEAMKNTKEKVILKKKKLPESKIHLSPSILINGKDIEKILNKNSRLKSDSCKSCCKLVGHPVRCRTFSYKEISYKYIPKEMIMEALKKSYKTLNFQERVWKLLERIPRGKVTTYRLIAKKMKTKAYRAVGTACHNNKTTAPCYRVVRSDGTVGLCRHNDDCYKSRIRHLRKDGIKIKGNKIVDFEKRLFKF